MRKSLLILLIIIVGNFFFVDNVTAKPKTRQQAQKEVEAFLSQRGTTLSVKPAMARSASGQNGDTQESIYFFDVENNGGYVIVSGSDCSPSILGYTDNGSFDEQNIPENMKLWLDDYKRQIEYIEKLGTVAATSATSTSHPAIPTMLTTTWNQRYPYYLKCPTYNGTNCVTGCVATAIAQIMYYHRNKSVNQTTKEIPGYTINSNPTIIVNTIPEGSVIDWENMLNNYSSGNETSAQKNAVANLMAYCGAAVQMGYGMRSSGAYNKDVAPGLIYYFNYSETMTLENKSNYSDEEWDNLVYSELALGNPVYYTGASGSGGHAFVCDGYDGKGYYHINWGWGGMSDGHFLLSALNPSSQGTGGGNSGYNRSQVIIKGMVPKDNTFAGCDAYAEVSNGVMTFYYDKNRKTRGNNTYDVFTNDYSPTWNNSNDITDITKVKFDKSFSNWQPTSTQYWFNRFTNLTSIEGLENLNTSSVSKMYSMFSHCSNLKSIDMSNFNTSKTQNMGYMFYNCKELTEVKLPANLSKIDNNMFSGCSSIQAITIPKSVSIIGEYAFWNCKSLATITTEFAPPFEIKSNTFPSSIYSSATLKVPEGKKPIYSLTKGWSLFQNIEEPQKTTYTLKYLVDDVEYKTYQVVKGTVITPEKEPTRESYTFSGWSDIPQIMPAEDVTITGHFFKDNGSAIITIPSEGQTTFCYDLPLDFSSVSGIEAFIVCGYNINSGNIQQIKVREVPAGTGIIVKGKAGTYTIPVKETLFYYKNMLKPVFKETTIPASEGNYANYIMVNGKLTKLNGSAKVTANSAYLPVPITLF